MTNYIDLLLLLCCFTSCYRLIAFQRQGLTFKRRMAFIAWLAIVLTGGTGLLILVGNLSCTTLHPVLILALLCFTALVFIARGNISQIIRMTRGLV